jgi:hypothetical protein
MSPPRSPSASSSPPSPVQSEASVQNMALAADYSMQSNPSNPQMRSSRKQRVSISMTPGKEVETGKKQLIRRSSSKYAMAYCWVHDFTYKLSNLISYQSLSSLRMDRHPFSLSQRGPELIFGSSSRPPSHIPPPNPNLRRNVPLGETLVSPSLSIDASVSSVYSQNKQNKISPQVVPVRTNSLSIV